MKYCVLNELLEFIPGVNPSRYNSEADTSFYDSNAFNLDYVSDTNNEEVNFQNNTSIVCEGDVIYNLSSQKCVIASKQSEGMMLTNNFVKLVAKKNIYSKYLIYILNEDGYVKKQKDIGLQGATIQRLTVSFLKEIKMPYLELDKQKMIGDIYAKTILLQHELSNYSNMLEKASNSFISTFLKGEKHERI